MIYPPDGIERSRASANCVGSHLHSTWWSQAQYAYTTSLNPFANTIGGLGQSLGLGGLGDLGQELFGSLSGKGTNSP